jgi:hypothetical protein
MKNPRKTTPSSSVKKPRKKYSVSAPIKDVAASSITFHFEVDGRTKKFTYKPDDDWAYKTGEKIRFESPSGPFKITLERIDTTSTVTLRSSPLGDVLEGEQDGPDMWAAKVTAGDGGLTEDERARANRDNRPPGGQESDGFVARYLYKIEVTNGAEIVNNDDDTKNGSFIC